MRMFITSKKKYLSNDMKIFGTCSIPLKLTVTATVGPFQSLKNELGVILIVMTSSQDKDWVSQSKTGTECNSPRQGLGVIVQGMERV